MGIVFLNGDFLSEEKALIPISDRGFLFGDGVFTTLRVADGIIEFPSMHLNRLFDDARRLHISPPIFQEEWLRRLVVQNQAFSGTWKLKILLTGGTTADLGIAPRSGGILLMTLKSYQEKVLNFQRLTFFPFPLQRPSAQIKTLSYLDRLMVKEYARQREVDDAVVTHSAQSLLETSFSNLFWCVGNDFFTPSPSLPLLFGTTVRLVEDVVRSFGMRVHYTETALEDVDHDAQFFLCNALQGICSVQALEGRVFKINSLFQNDLKRAYCQLVKKLSWNCRGI